MEGTHTQTSNFQCHFNTHYLLSPPGILKIIEIVFGIIAFACATSIPYGWCGFGWVSFVGISGFIGAIISLICHILMTVNWKWTILIELIWYGIWTIFFLIAGIVAAAQANCLYISYFGWTPTAGAAAAFSFFAMVAWAADTALQAQYVRISWSSSTTSGPTNTTTTNQNADRFEVDPKY